jgi:preprotein translocase subunit Sec63
VLLASAVLLRVELAAFPRALYRDPYEVLGLPKNATTEQIKKAYKVRAVPFALLIRTWSLNSTIFLLAQ